MAFTPTLTKDSDLAAVRGAMREAAEHIIELRSVPADKRGTSYADDVKTAVDFIHEFDVVERGMSAGERAKRDQDEAEARAAGQVRGPNGAFSKIDAEARSAGERVTLDDEWAEWAKQGGSRGGKRPFQMEVRTLLGEYTAGVYAQGANSFMPVGQPFLPPQSLRRRRLFVRDLLTVQETGLPLIPYFTELNPLTNETGAGNVTEGSAKPEVTMQFTPATAIVQKIAAWIPATEEILMDAPTLRGYIDSRLAYMLDLREEQQLLAGTGTAPELQGLATLSGTQTQAAVVGDVPATLAAAIGKVENVDGEADAAAMNPVDFWTAVAQRHSTQFDNGFGGAAPASVPDGGGISWGLPVVRTRALTTLSAWVASWRLGGTVFDRMQTTIKVGDQHSDWMIRNLVLILAERREAVAWFRPDFFVKTTLQFS